MQKIVLLTFVLLLVAVPITAINGGKKYSFRSLPAEILNLLSLDSECSGRGYKYNGVCYCLDAFAGATCEQNDFNGWNDDTSQVCDDLVNRLDHLLNETPDQAYVDDNMFSRLKGNQIGEGEAQYGKKGTVWIPMHGISKEPFTIFGKSGQIHPRNVAQGSLGNCYLLAAVAALVNIRHGEIIKDMFQTDHDNANRIYIARWFIDGKPIYVSTDDYVPGTVDGTSSFASHKQGQFWAAIIEKQWAKIHGDYMRTVGGDTRVVWRAITGAPTQMLTNAQTSADEIFQKLKTAYDNQWAMGAGTPADQSLTKLVKGHAYAVLGAYEINHNGQSVKLIKCYNPHAEEKTYPQNPWAVGSNNWTEDIIRVVGHINENNGQFFLSIDDFKENFENFYWAEIRQGYIISYQQIPLRDNNDEGLPYAVYTAKITNTGSEPFTVSVEEVDDRLLGQDSTKTKCQKPFNLGYGFTITTPSGVSTRASLIGAGINSFSVDQAEQGDYNIQIRVYNVLNYHKFFTVNVYHKPETIKFHDRTDKYIPPQDKTCPDACSFHGLCNTYNGQCICDFSYSGDNCATYTKPTCPGDCGGEAAGVCGVDGKCTCNPGHRLNADLSCEACRDTIDWCPQFVRRGLCTKSQQQAARACPKLCQVGTCKVNCPSNCGGAAAGVCAQDGSCKCNPGYKLNGDLFCEECKDTVDSCEGLSQAGVCTNPQYLDQALRECPKYCQIGTCKTSRLTPKVNFKKSIMHQILKKKLY